MYRISFLLISLILAGPLQAADGVVSHGATLTLQEARSLMQANNRELLAGRRVVEGLQADSLTAAQAPNPTLSLNSTSWRLGGGNGPGLWDKRVDTIVRYDQLIERGNKRALREAASQEAIEAGRHDLGELQRQQEIALSGVYYDLVLAQEKERIEREMVDLFERNLQAAEFRLKAGDIAAADVARIQVDALRAQNDLRAAVSERNKTQLTLAYMIGMNEGATSLQASDSFPAVMTDDPTLDESLLEQRADMQAARARIRQAEKQRELAESLKTRDVTIGVQYEHFPTDANNSVGAGISIPLFTNYQYQGEIARAEVNRNAALDDLERVRAQALAEIQRARADRLAAIERAKRFDDAVLRAAQQSADAAMYAYQHGASGVTDLLDATRTLRLLQIESAMTHADYAKADAAWRAAISPEASMP